MRQQFNPVSRSTFRLFHAFALAGVLLTCSLAGAQEVALLSEKDFLTDMPIVLSVSRLPQRLDETPGTVTVMDREMIQLSGARDIVDLLRLVPGFQVSTSFESSAPVVSYHGGFNIFSGRIELLIDGRSAYSPYFVGNIGPGLQSLALADIERIEVLRGSNSAAYGARAILGVINIVTRHSADTLGAMGSARAGQNGIRDLQARLGWGNDSTTHRLTADRRSDDGLHGAHNQNSISRLNYRSDINLSGGDALQMHVGGYVIDSGKGNPGDKNDPGGDVNDPPRDGLFRSEFVQVDWRRNLGQNEDLLFRASHTQERYSDDFAYSLIPLGIKDSINIGFGGRSRAESLMVQHSLRHSEDLRWVWGGEFRSERITSRALFNRDDALKTDFSRLFGNLEWGLSEAVLLNAGAMLEHSSVMGNTLAPRLMLNWQVSPGHTLRAGVSRAYRPPSNFEQFGDVRYYWRGKLLAVNTLATGQVDSERLTAREISYLGEFPQWAASLDVRVFNERMDDFVVQAADKRPWYYANQEGFNIQGLEYQLKWQPWSGAQLLLNQAYTRIAPTVEFSTTDLAAPRLATSLALFQRLPGEVDVSLMYYRQGISRFIGAGWHRQPKMDRADLRVAKRLRWGAQRGELALVVQNLGGPYPDYDPSFLFKRQAWLSLTLER